MRKSKLLRALLTLLVFAGFIVYFLLNLKSFKILLHVNAYLFILIALGNVLNITSSGLTTKVILQPFEKFIGMRESVRVALISTIGNFFAPAGSGFGFRAVYLKKRHGLAYGDYMATLYGNYLIVFLVNALFGLIALWLLRAKSSPEYFVLVLIFAGLFVVSTLLSLVKIPTRFLERDLRVRQLDRITKMLLQILKGWNRIIDNKRLMSRLVLLTIFNVLTALFVAKMEILSLHLGISFSALILFGVLNSLSLFVSITPANLGVKEAIYLFSGHVMGFSVSQILSIALVDRGVLFLTLAVMWLLTSRTRAAARVEG